MVSDEFFSNRKQGTVFNYKIVLKRENLTKSGYFDLTKISSLRIIDNVFLKLIRKEHKLRQKDIAIILGVPLRTVIGWECYKKAMPYKLLVQLSHKLKIGENEFYSLIKNSEFTFGEHHGKNRVKLPLKPEEFEMIKYIRPIEPDRVYLVKNTPEQLKAGLLKKFSIDEDYFNKTGLITIYSYLLNRFIKTFYSYKKELKLKFPLSKEVPEWIKANVNLTKAVIIPLLITDGGEKPACIFCSGASDIVHDIWSDAVYYEFDHLPSSFKLPYRTIFITSHRLPKDLLVKIKNFSPSFKTSPINETSEAYFRLPQPSISYLKTSSKLEQQIALRLWAITEGSISIHNDKRGGLITPSLKIACAHPNLVKELKEIAKLNNLNMSSLKGYNVWSGVSGLQTSAINSIVNFLKIGGFVRGVKVAKSRSPYFGGFDKQDVLLGILEFMKRQREDERYRFSDIEKINKHIRAIILSKHFRDEKYYISYFEKCY